MPAIAVFKNKLKIYIYRDDHQPPHFHAVYQNCDARVIIDSLAVKEASKGKSRIPPRIRKELLAWAKEHQLELKQAWEKIQNSEPPPRISPP